MTWTQFTKRTDDPKLSVVEHYLTKARIRHKRDGASFHAPILMVEEGRLNDAWAILEPIDDIPDDDPLWVDDPLGCSCSAPEDGLCASCLIEERIAAMK
jgi:hypothetical protein